MHLLPALVQETKQLNPVAQKIFNKYLLFFEKRSQEIEHGH